ARAAGRSARGADRRQICRPAGSAREESLPGTASTRDASRTRSRRAFDLGSERAQPLVKLLVATIDLLHVVHGARTLRGERRRKESHAGANIRASQLRAV